MTLLMLNFGTFQETNIFAHELLHQGFALYDSTNGSPASGLSLSTVKGPTAVYTLFRTGAKEWTQSGEGLSYSERFRRWIQGVVDTEPEVVYLTGHHASSPSSDIMILANDWPEDKIRFGVGFPPNAGSMRFFVPSRLDLLVEVDLAPAKRACRLVVGFGCNVAQASSARFYQRVFSAGAKRSIVLGWRKTMTIPQRGQGSINRVFFTELAAIPGVEGSSIGDVCARWPAEVIQAWGTAVATFGGGPPVSGELFTNAAARDAEGVQYKYEIVGGKVRPVRA